NLLNEWMDPRHIMTHALALPTDEERERPTFYRFWRRLPPKGTIGIFLGSWHSEPIVQRVYGRDEAGEMDARLEEIVRFERLLADDGALVMKVWLHLSAERQRKRLRKLSKDPRTAWRVTGDDWRNFARYDRFKRISERALRRTSTAHAPWLVVEGA